MSAPAGDAPLEIERTFLLREMPRLPESAECWRIEQGYLHGTADAEGRVRRSVSPDGAESFTHTIKHGTGLVRREQERGIEREEFQRLWEHTGGRRLRKERFKVNDRELTWEIDRFIGLPPIEGRNLVLAEVEIPASMDPAKVEIPPWVQSVLVREVTDEPRFRNYSLASASATI